MKHGMRKWARGNSAHMQAPAEEKDKKVGRGETSAITSDPDRYCKKITSVKFNQIERTD